MSLWLLVFCLPQGCRALQGLRPPHLPFPCHCMEGDMPPVGLPVGQQLCYMAVYCGFRILLWNHMEKQDCARLSGMFCLFSFFFFFNDFAANWRRGCRQLTYEHAARERHGCMQMEDAAGTAWLPSSAPEGFLGVTPAISASVTLQPVFLGHRC